MSADDKKISLQYEIKLPETVDEILEQEVFILENFGGSMLTGVDSPMKFSAFTSIYVRTGTATAELNLRQFRFEAPCVVNIRPGTILHMIEASEDFNASFMVFSEKFENHIFSIIGGPLHVPTILRHRIMQIPEKLVEEYDYFYAQMIKLQQNHELLDLSKALFYSTIAFYYATASRCLPADPASDEVVNEGSRWLSDRFLLLVQKHFKSERFLQFYADELKVSTKYLSRIVKMQTGVSAAEWIQRHVILEAKVLLKSSNLNVQQISLMLNFQSQSLFGKYFKTATGMSPKDFRNL